MSFLLAPARKSWSSLVSSVASGAVWAGRKSATANRSTSERRIRFTRVSRTRKLKNRKFKSRARNPRLVADESVLRSQQRRTSKKRPFLYEERLELCV